MCQLWVRMYCLRCCVWNGCKGENEDCKYLSQWLFTILKNKLNACCNWEDCHLEEWWVSTKLACDSRLFIPTFALLGCKQTMPDTHGLSQKWHMEVVMCRSIAHCNEYKNPSTLYVYNTTHCRNNIILERTVNLIYVD